MPRILLTNSFHWFIILAFFLLLRLKLLCLATSHWLKRSSAPSFLAPCLQQVFIGTCYVSLSLQPLVFAKVARFPNLASHPLPLHCAESGISGHSSQKTLLSGHHTFSTARLSILFLAEEVHLIWNMGLCGVVFPLVDNIPFLTSYGAALRKVHRKKSPCWIKPKGLSGPPSCFE